MTVMEKDIRRNIYGAFWRRVEVQSHLFRFRVCFRVGVKGLGIKEDMGFFVTQVLIGLLETTSEILSRTDSILLQAHKHKTVILCPYTFVR